MKKLLLSLFIISAGFVKSQCSLTASVTPPSCPGNCDASVTITIGAACTSFPYTLTINGGSCTPSGSFTMTSSTITFSNLCGCGSPFSAVLMSGSFPVAFTNFAVFDGVPVTNFQVNNAPASCSACCNGTITTSTGGGTAPYSYTWSPVGGNTGTLTNACPGVYTLCVTDSKGCSACNSYTMGFSTGISENEMAPAQIFYSKEEIVILDVMPIHAITVYDLTGRVVFKSENNTQKEFRLNKNQFSKGVYVINVEGSKRLSKHKIIIE